MGLIATFDFATWQALFAPAFDTITQPQAELALTLATQYWPNDGSSMATTMVIQTNLLYLIEAHVVQLLYGVNGQPPSGLVGRIASAGEGSVNVSTEWPTNPDNAWFLQTSYGAMFWQAILPYRSGPVYVGGPRRINNPWPRGNSGWGW